MAFREIQGALSNLWGLTEVLFCSVRVNEWPMANSSRSFDWVGRSSLDVVSVSYVFSDLHFHIVMQNLSSKLSESCEELKDVRVVQGSPQQMENLEAKIKALSAELHEVQSRNLYLSSIIEEQKQ